MTAADPVTYADPITTLAWFAGYLVVVMAIALCAAWLREQLEK